MFLVYGSMLDTPITSLPFGIAVVLAWERGRRGGRVPLPLAAALTGIAVPSGWQSLLVAVIVGGWAIARLVRRSGRRSLDAAFATGALVGLAFLAAWLLWAFGWTLAPLLDQFRARTGWTAPVPVGELVAATVRDTGGMYVVVAALAAPGLVLGLADRKMRGVVALALAVTVPYPLRLGAVNHDYWNFWLLLPVALGLAIGCDRVIRRRAVGRGPETFLAGAVGAVAVVLAAALWLRPDASSWAALEGRRAGRAVASHQVPPAQSAAWYTGAVGKPAGWLALATQRQAIAVAVDELPALAATHPEDLVMVGRMRCIDGTPRIDYSFERAVDLPAAPPPVQRCR